MADKKSPTAVELADIDLNDGLEMDLNFPLANLLDDANMIEPEGNVDAKLQLHISDDDVYVTGSIYGSVLLECGRCLGKYGERLGGKLAVPYLPVGSEGIDEQDVYTYEDDRIDMHDMLREQLLLTMPVRQVCSEECKGLCPKCGVDLNKDSCSCPKKNVDARLAVLAELKDKLN